MDSKGSRDSIYMKPSLHSIWSITNSKGSRDSIYMKPCTQLGAPLPTTTLQRIEGLHSIWSTGHCLTSNITAQLEYPTSCKVAWQSSRAMYRKEESCSCTQNIQQGRNECYNTMAVRVMQVTTRYSDGWLITACASKQLICTHRFLPDKSLLNWDCCFYLSLIIT